MTHYTDPQRCGAQGLTDGQIASWRNRGFALVDGLLPEDLLRTARNEQRAVLGFHYLAATTGRMR